MRNVLLLLIRFYQLAFSPFLGNCCRFYPSCSEYAAQAVQTQGCVKGCWLTLKRVVKCHPWHSGGLDFPP